MKKILIILILILLVNVKASVQGDINLDGKVSTVDYIMVKNHIIGVNKLKGNNLTMADVNNDKKVNALDYISIINIMINGTQTKDITPVIDSNKNYITAYFLNTMNNSNYQTTYVNNDAFVFATTTNKYILLDTGVKSDEIKNTIYNKLKELQKKDKITLDYMIISHMHSDHYGNAINIMKDSKFVIKNLIIKSESISTIDENIIATAKSKNINIIDTDAMISEGQKYQIDDYITMYLFNVKDVYKNENCNNKAYILKYANRMNETNKNIFARTKTGNYIFFEGSEYIKNDYNTKIYLNKNQEFNRSNPLIKSRYYATYDLTNQCTSNSNSITVVFQIKTNNGNKYIYLPSDLQNSGYSPFGEMDNKYKTIIHGHPSTYYVKYTMMDGVPKFYVQDNKLVPNPDINPIKKPMEYVTAKNVVNKLKDISNNIVIYQQSHHGINNAKEAISTLNVNRSNIYTILSGNYDINNTGSFTIAESGYLLGKTNIMRVSNDNTKKRNGIKCIINGAGKTTCNDF